MEIDELVNKEAEELISHVIECNRCAKTDQVYYVGGKDEATFILCDDAMKIRSYYDAVFILVDAKNVDIIGDTREYHLNLEEAKT